MINSMVPSHKIARANKIRESAVLEFAVVSHQPLIAYCLIQGTAKDPYIVIFDLEENVLAHNCPDFAHGGWCKHIGKLLLLLTDPDVKQISDQKRALRIERQACSQVLQTVKTKQLQKNPLDPDMKLEDRLEFYCHAVTAGNITPEQIKSFFIFIADELIKLAPELALIRVTELLKLVQEDALDSFLRDFGNIFVELVKKELQNFFRNLWIQKTERKLVEAHLLGNLSSQLKIPIEISLLTVPEQSSANELKTIRIIVECLCHAPLNQKWLQELPDALNFQKKDLDAIYGQVKSKLVISSCTYSPIFDWLQSKLKCTQSKKQQLPAFLDDFLIYILESAGERPIYPISINRYEDYTRYSYKFLFKFPALKYVFDHVKESGREYLLNREIRMHQRFFDWLAEKSITSQWTENPRDKLMNILIPREGIIIQWDINACRFDQEFLEAFDGDNRIILDPSSPIFANIQPFDFTLCRFPLLNRPDWTSVAHTSHILTPDQVIERISKGMRIISNILPWDILHSYAMGKNLMGATIARGIKTCSDLSFIYGSLDLKTELDYLYRLSLKGLSQDKYKIYRKTLCESSRRLNQDTRVICHEIIISEGKSLTFFRGLYEFPFDDKFLSLVLKTCVAAETIEEFRKLILSAIFVNMQMTKTLTLKVLQKIQNYQIGNYNMAPLIFAQILSKELKIVKKSVGSFNQKNIQKIANSLIGHLLMKESHVSSEKEIKSHHFIKIENILKEIEIQHDDG